MGNFFAGALISALCILGFQYYAGDKQQNEEKDTVSIRMADQIIELSKDSVK